MQNLYPIIRRKRRPLLPEEPPAAVKVETVKTAERVEGRESRVESRDLSDAQTIPKRNDQ